MEIGKNLCASVPFSSSDKASNIAALMATLRGPQADGVRREVT